MALGPKFTKYRHVAGALLGLALFAAAVYVLRRELRDYHKIVAQLEKYAGHHRVLWRAVGLTMLAYLVLTGYDLLAMRWIRHRLSLGKVAFTSFLSYVFSNNIGMSVFGASAVRLRLYSGWGLSVMEIVKVVAFAAFTFWLGLLSCAGLAFLIEPMPLPQSWRIIPGLENSWPLGIVLMVLVVGYMVACLLRRKPVRLGNKELAVPSFRIAVAQTIVGTLDWALASGIFYVLLNALMPRGHHLQLSTVMVAYFLAIVPAQASHVPGGLGVFEVLMVSLLAPSGVPEEAALAAALAYRGIYLILPLSAGVVCLGSYEMFHSKGILRRIQGGLSRWGIPLLPLVLAVLSFLSGAVLLISGATPAVQDRIHRIKGLLPLGVLEASHFLGSIIGVGLLLLARGLQRRLDAAWHLAALLLAAGIIASLLKGLDYEEAIALAAVLVVLLSCHKLFYRKASLISQRLSIGWIIATLLVLASAAWLGIACYAEKAYSAQMWWEFAFGRRGDAAVGNASRFMRAMVGVGVVTFLFAMARLMRPGRPAPACPTERDLADTRRIVATSSSTAACLALLGDKRLLFNDDRTAFIMYSIEGRSWVAMGDPVGPPEACQELIWQFYELADRHFGLVAFYQVAPERLHQYVDLGLTMVKLGEEARVPLAEFSLDGRDRKPLRHYLSRALKEEVVFEVVPADSVPALLGELKAVSDAWLAGRDLKERGFSLGFFDEAYLSQFPAAVVRQHGRIVAFANLWPGADQEELSIDLMRYLPDGPSEVMDFLFIQLMLWGREQGYRFFNLGMAPLSGLQDSSLAPLWNRVGGLLFRYGEQFYNFQGLRAYKDKFDPQWLPKYLACPRKLALPQVLANIASLISRGPRAGKRAK